MEVRCGIDIIEIDRIKSSIDELGDRFLNRIFTKNEIEYCESKKLQKYEHYAARFAAKEATFKAISKLIPNKFSVTWKDFEVINSKEGKPSINLFNINDNRIDSIDLSISHCKLYAVANVIVMYKEK